jgi:t-SNARE complex subunit (syntaxin)
MKTNDLVKEFDDFIEHAKNVAISRMNKPFNNDEEAKIHYIIMKLIQAETANKMLLATIEKYRVVCRKNNLSIE